MEITCPACGSDTVIKKTKEANIPIEFGRDVQVEETIYFCQDCGTDGDFADENDKKIKHALEVARKQSTDLILDTLAANGVSMAYFERAMGLPARTLARWKKGKVSASGFALIKTIETYPWILEVADERFDKCFAITTMIQKAAEAIEGIMTPHIVCKTQSIRSSGEIATINTSITLRRNIKTPTTIINNSTTGQIAWK